MLKKHLFKVLGISMLAAIGVMAMNASAAQAKWLILKGTNSVLEIELKISSDHLGTLLVPGLLQIECHKAKGTAKIHLSADHKKLLGKGSVLFLECLVKDSTGKVNNNCTVKSPSQPAGAILATGEGEGAQSGSSVVATLTSESFAEVEISGALCPLDEFDDSVSGSATLTLDESTTKTKLKKVLIDDKELFYFENEALLHDGVNAANPVLGSVEEISGEEWLIKQLVL